MKRNLCLSYVVVLHLVIVMMLWRSDFISQVATQLGLAKPKTGLSVHFQRMRSFHRRSVDIVPKDSVIFIGDSLIQGLYVRAVASNAVNYGIAGDTTLGVLERLGDYEPALKNSLAIVLAIGINDLRHRPNSEIVQNYARILDALPTVSVFVSSILPVDEFAGASMSGYGQRIIEINASLRSLASNRANVTYIDNSDFLDANRDQRLDTDLHIGDGIHLNSNGNARWVMSLKREIANIDS